MSNSQDLVSAAAVTAPTVTPAIDAPKAADAKGVCSKSGWSGKCAGGKCAGGKCCCCGWKWAPVALIAGAALGGVAICGASYLYKKYVSPTKKKPTKSIGLTPELHDYLVSVSCRQNQLLKELEAETHQSCARATMCSPLDSASLLQMLVHVTHAKKVIEVGVFTGFTTLALALALPDDGKVIACDIDEKWPNTIGKKYWQRANVAHKIDLKIAPATETLDRLLDQKDEIGTYDLAFIDADKDNYDSYYERSLKLLRRGGIIAVDNTLWSGRVLDPRDSTPPTEAIRKFNKKVFEDQRVHICMVPTSDGITICFKI